uniref:Uncharacterized protein n=1 Tax=Triticum urartu TaxID=4572 RepID=A0A8R7QSQ1_TRIUA
MGMRRSKGAHTRKSEARSSMRKQKEKTCSLESDQASATSSKPGVYHVLGIGGMFLWGDKLKKIPIIGRARCIPCSRDRWYVPMKRAIRHYNRQDSVHVDIEMSI